MQKIEVELVSEGDKEMHYIRARSQSPESNGELSPRLQQQAKKRLAITAAVFVSVIVLCALGGLIYQEAGNPFGPVNQTNPDLTPFEERSPDGIVLAIMFSGVVLVLLFYAALFSSPFRKRLVAALEDTTVQQIKIEEGYTLECWARDEPRQEPEQSCSEAILKALGKLPFAFATFPQWLLVYAVVCGLLVVGFGAMGFFLMTGIASMPKRDDTPAWTEVSWQVINGVFTTLALWRHPQRIRFAALLFKGDYRLNQSQRGEGTGPEDHERYAVLLFLTEARARTVCIIRNLNCFFQYIVCIFMWGYLPRCWEEERRLNRDCQSRPGWAVPVFLVLAMGCDIVSNVITEAGKKELHRLYKVTEKLPSGVTVEDGEAEALTPHRNSFKRETRDSNRAKSYDSTDGSPFLGPDAYPVESEVPEPKLS